VDRATDQDDPCTWDRDELRLAATAGAVSERGAGVHRHRPMPTEQRAVSHEEVRLHPPVALRRYRDRRRVASTPGSKPDHHQVALRRRRCEADLRCDPLDYTTERLRPTGAEEHDRALRPVVNGDDDGETPSRNTTGVHSTRPRRSVTPRATARATFYAAAWGKGALHGPLASSAAAYHGEGDERRRQQRQRVHVLRHRLLYVAAHHFVTEEYVSAGGHLRLG
jgi:hypothetical protein